jgi:hypothetical protein
MSRRWVKPKSTPQTELQLIAPRGRFTPAVKIQTDTAIAAGESIGLKRGGDQQFERIGDLASAMTGVLEKHTRRVKLAGVMLAVAVRKEVLDYLTEHPEGATADEIAYVLKRSVLTVRPRCAELHVKMKAIVDSGERRPNASGKSAIVWRKADG